MWRDDDNLDRFQSLKQPRCWHDNVQLQQSHGHLVAVFSLWMKNRPVTCLWHGCGDQRWLLWKYFYLIQFQIYIIITKNIRYLLWNWGFWCSLNSTYPTFLTLCIRCTNHLYDSCDLTDVNPHFIPSLLGMIQNVDLLWRHRYKSRPPAIVTSQWPIVPAWLLRTLS